MNIPSFNDFNINAVTEEMTTADRMEKGSELNNKLDTLKKQLKEAIDKKDNKKADALQIKIEIAELDIKKFDLQKKLEKISK